MIYLEENKKTSRKKYNIQVFHDGSTINIATLLTDSPWLIKIIKEALSKVKYEDVNG